MAVRCSYCGRDYDVTLFEFGRTVICECGKTVTFRHEETTGDVSSALKSEEINLKEIITMADRISFLIVSTDYPLIDIEIEKQKLREKIEELFPEKADLYGLIYEPRFKRLTEQFREK